MKLPDKLPDGWRLDPRTPHPIADPYLIVSFFTSGPGGRGYEEETDGWLQTFSDHGHGAQLLLVDVGHVSTWWKATFLKPSVIKWAMSAGHDVLWVDIDGRCRQPIHLPDGDYDIACRLRNEPRFPCWMSGTAFFRNTPASVKLVDDWEFHSGLAAAREGEFFDVAGDQEVLGFLASRRIRDGRLKLEVLSPAMTYIFDIDRHFHRDIDPIIEHMQTSRRRADVREGRRLCLEYPL